MTIQIKEIPALGTHWWFDLFGVPLSREKEIADRLISRLNTFEQQYSRFLHTSYIGVLNKTGTLNNPSAELVSLLQFGQKLYRDTGGMFNFLSAHTQVSRGYGSPDSVRADESATIADPTVDLVVDRQHITLHRGAVDLGGFGKGWLIDDLAALLRTSLGVQHFLINGGGDIYASTLPDDSPVAIFVEHPTEQKHIIAKVPLTNQGFAGSGTYKRRWQRAGTPQHHIIAEHTADITAHTVADTALTADVFATLACAVAPSDAPHLLQDNNLDYLLIQRNAVSCSEYFKQCLLSPA